MRTRTPSVVAFGWALVLVAGTALGQQAEPSAAPAAATASPAPPAAAPPPAPPGPAFYAPQAGDAKAAVRVTMNGAEEGLGLYRRDDTRKWISNGYGFDTWELVCRAPCGVDVASSSRLVVMGPDVLPSDPFTLPKSKGPTAVSLDVDPGSETVRSVTRFIGVLALGASVAFLLGSMPMEDTDFRTGALIAGSACFGVGTVMLWVVPAFNETTVEVR